MKTRTYMELVRFETFAERLDYLRLGGGVGNRTFGFDRHVNQRFYASREWHDIREHVIYRDNGCDLGVAGYEIHVDLLVHHINPIALEDLVGNENWVLDPNFLITTTHVTHNAIHYGMPNPYPNVVLGRAPGDTKLW